MTVTIEIEPLPGTSIAEEKEVARFWREELILPALRRDEEVELDFERTQVVTQSFIHALLAEVICRFEERALELLEFRRCSSDVRQVIETVIDYTFMALDEGSSKIGGVHGPGV
jgi:hypothetical protein